MALRGINVRTTRRAHARSRVHWLHRILLPFCLTTPAAALPPLITAADVAQPNLQAFWKPGVLWIGMPDKEGRPGIRPLVDTSPMVLPPSLEEWTAIGETCDRPPETQARFGGHPIEAIITGDEMHPIVRIIRNGRPIADSLLGRPATVCELRIVEADDLPGPELIAAWRTDGPNPVRGYTVYRIPEALDPTPASPDPVRNEE